MKKHLIFITLLIASVFVYFGCSTFNDSSNNSVSSPNPHSGKGGANIASVGLPEGWDLAGIDHYYVMKPLKKSLLYHSLLPHQSDFDDFRNELQILV